MRGEYVTVITSRKRILREGRRTTTALSTATPVGNPPILPKSLEAAIEKLITPVPRAAGEDTSDGLAESSVLEERLALRIRPTQSHSLALLDGRVRNQFAILPVLVVDGAAGLFCDARRATKSSPDTKVAAVIRAVTRQGVAKVFQCFAFDSAIDRELHKSLAEPHVSDDMATRTTYLQSLR